MNAVINTRKRTSGLSVTSVTTGILSLIPVGPGLLLGPAAIICGTLDLYMKKNKGDHPGNRGADVSGITLGAVGLIGTFAVVVYSVVVIISKYGIDSWL
jgi:hypothetical protein